jgi:hypothetical protein
MLISCFAGKVSAQIEQHGFVFHKENLVFNMHFGAGYSPLYYSKDKISGQSLMRDNRSGLSFELGGTYFFSPQWGVAMGFGISNYRTTGSLQGYSDAVTGLTDSDGHDYTMQITGHKIAENQQLRLLDIPITAQHWLALKNGMTLATGAGFKLGFPIKKEYVMEESDITTRAYYPDLNFTLTGHEASGMYENRTDWNPSGKLETKVNLSLLLETGVLYPLTDNIDVNAKGYFAYGLNKLSEGNELHVMEAPEQYNSLSGLAGNMKNMSIGIKIGVFYDFNF